MLFESFMLFLTEKDNSDSFKPNLNPDQYRVSSIPYCNRKAYFVKTGHENRSSNYLSRLASEGKLHHTAAQVDAEEYTKKILGLEVAIEDTDVLFYPNGTIDGKDIKISDDQNSATIYITESVGRIELKRDEE